MPRYIVKLTEEDKSWYMEWSTVVDAPVTYGMSLENFKQYYKEMYGLSSLPELEQRLERCEAKGTSSMIDDDADEVISFNRAGKNETILTKQQIIDCYCKAPDFETDEEFKAWWDKNLPVGTEHKYD